MDRDGLETRSNRRRTDRRGRGTRLKADQVGFSIRVSFIPPSALILFSTAFMCPEITRDFFSFCYIEIFIEITEMLTCSNSHLVPFFISLCDTYLLQYLCCIIKLLDYQLGYILFAPGERVRSSLSLSFLLSLYVSLSSYRRTANRSWRGPL